MKVLFSQLRPAIAATFVLAAVTCGFYPLVITSIAQVAFKDQANGSLIVDKEGRVRGSALLGQNFTAAQYFHSRPSAAGSGYDGAGSGGSNLGPTSQKLHDQIKGRIAAYRAANGLTEKDEVPADAVTASGSGLDPHISVRNAQLQAARVARARRLTTEKVLELIGTHQEEASWGFLGEPGINVLRLNLALDELR